MHSPYPNLNHNFDLTVKPRFNQVFVSTKLSKPTGIVVSWFLDLMNIVKPAHTHTDNELLVKLLSISGKCTVWSPSCHTQVLSVQTPKLVLFSHLHPSSCPDPHAYQTQAKRLKAFSSLCPPPTRLEKKHTCRLALKLLSPHKGLRFTYSTLFIMFKGL